MLHWISREPLHCVRWRFTAYDGTAFYDEIWLAPLSPIPTEPWGNKLSNLSGQVEVSIPVSTDLPWYRLPFQKFHPSKRIPFRHGLIHGSVISFDQQGNEVSIKQYRDGQEHGIYSWFNADGSFSHLTSSRKGKLDGPRISCWTNGLLSATDVYTNGEKNGLARHWNRMGRLLDEGTFTGYQPTGIHSFWLHQNGAKSHETQYSTNGIAMATTVWAADGSRIGTSTYKDGRMWDGYFVHTFKGYISLDQYSEGKRLKSDLDWLKETSEIK